MHAACIFSLYKKNQAQIVVSLKIVWTLVWSVTVHYVGYARLMFRHFKKHW